MRRGWLAHGLFALLVVASYPALAHDYWIEPDSFHVHPGQRIALHHFVGQDFSGLPVPYLPDRHVRYDATGPRGRQAITGVLGDDPAGSFQAVVPGHYVVALQTRPENVEFENRAEFESYLRKEGLESHLAAVRARAEGKIRESYFRCAKSLITAGSAAGTRDRALGLPLELVAHSMPEPTGTEDVQLLYESMPLDLQLLYEGKPLQGALVILFNKVTPLDKLKARTDSDGRVQFRLPRRGVWLATAVHLRPAAWHAKEDWNSLWASLTFELR